MVKSVSTDKLLVLRVGGGLCNRLRAILSALEWAEMERRRLLVAWPMNSTFNARLEDLVRTPPITIHPKFVSLAAKLVGGYRSEKSIKAETDKWLLVVSTGSVLKREGKFIEYGPRLRSINPSAEVQRRIDSIAIPTGPTVGVMIRAAEHSHRYTLAASPPEWYFARMEQLRDEVPNVTFFLSTDNPQISREVHSRFPGTLEQPNEGPYNSRLSIIKAMADLYLLARTEFILGAHFSSFSETAALLSGHGGYETSRLRPLESWEERLIDRKVQISRLQWSTEQVSASLYFPNEGPTIEAS